MGKRHVNIPRLYAVINSTIPAPARLLGEGGGTLNLLVRFLVIEHPEEGLILVDGGYGPEISSLESLKGLGYRTLIGAPETYCTPAEALRQMGYDPQDIRHVILTHLHADHICNLGFIPRMARLHLSKPDITILNRFVKTGKAPGLRSGLFPELVHGHLITEGQAIDECPHVSIDPGCGRKVTGFDLLGDGSILAVHLPGHTPGHFGIFVPQVLGEDNGVLYGVDVAWTFSGLKAGSEPFFSRIVGHNSPLSDHSRAIVRRFLDAGHLVVLCHDPDETPVDINPMGV
jgi:glyoxylase-like metal-dependent hydrolase (beta-lactamase superfamily II)